ncbi:pyridoxal phosphate-dependent aminotransferase, partial [Nonomuraea sp. NPDC005692]
HRRAAAEHAGQQQRCRDAGGHPSAGNGETPGGEEGYRLLCLDRAGVLPGTGSMVTSGPPGDGHAHVRLFLGHPWPILDEALDRLARHGLGWA